MQRWLTAINGHDANGKPSDEREIHRVRLARLFRDVSGLLDSRGPRKAGRRDGEAGGTIGGELWRTPAAWKAVIRDRKVAEWRVYADNKPVYEILGRRRK